MPPASKTENCSFVAEKELPGRIAVGRVTGPAPEKKPNRWWHGPTYWELDWMQVKTDWQPEEERRASEGSQLRPGLFQVPETSRELKMGNVSAAGVVGVAAVVAGTAVAGWPIAAG